MSRYDIDCELISYIQFKTNYSQTKKNKLMSLIEEHMAIEEQKELDGKGTGYYNDWYLGRNSWYTV